MNPNSGAQWIAFAAHQRIAIGVPAEVAGAVKRYVDSDPDATIMILECGSSRTVELDLRGSLQQVLARLSETTSALPELASVAGSATEAPNDAQNDAQNESAHERSRGRGRPRLGVIAREVTLLPRHWDWLGTQPGGASVALRKLVEAARRSSADTDRLREATESAYRFMFALASNAPGFEEASRSLFAGDLAKLAVTVEHWPVDIRTHLLDLASRVVTSTAAAPGSTAQAHK